MFIITDPAVRSRLADLYAAATAKAGALAEAERELSDLETKARTLRTRVAEQERPGPANEIDTTNLAAALVADPQAALDDDSLESATDAQVQADRTNAERRARVAVLTRALSNVTQLIDATQTRIEQAERLHEAALQELANECHQALLDEFRTRFVALHEAVIFPMLALQARGVTKRDHLSEESAVILRTWKAGVDEPRGAGLALTEEARAGSWRTERLLSFGHWTSAEINAGADQAIDAFYATLAS